MFAHGNQALTDDVELLYMMGGPYTPGYERGALTMSLVAIEWPLPVSVIDNKDQDWAALLLAAPLILTMERTHTIDASSSSLRVPGHPPVCS
jgi:hypothetical protein